MPAEWIAAAAPWMVLVGYCAFVWLFNPRAVTSHAFFAGGGAGGAAPGVTVVVFSAAISWIFAKSVANAADLGFAYGLAGGLGYTAYYLSFLVAGVAIYLLRTRGGWRSLPEFLAAKYGALCARLFLVAVAIRLFNEVWSNTKVGALYFGVEGSAAYWTAAFAISFFTLLYTVQGGMRSSLLTDVGQMLLFALLLAIVLLAVLPPLAERGLPDTPPAVSHAGLTFLGLALVQVLSYPFHDPVLTDRGFISPPRAMLRAFLLAGLLAGGCILLFSTVGLYARTFGLSGAPSVSVPAAFGLPMLMLFNAIMLTSAGSTIDSTFASTAKLAAVDWPGRSGAPGERERRIGRRWMIAIAIAGNAPLFAIYLGGAGPAIIAATTISGTMVMGLAPIFLLSFLRSAGPASFHLAFWPGIAFGVLKTAEGAASLRIFPPWLDIGSGAYADDLGLNLWGLAVCTGLYLLGALLFPRTAPAAAGATSS